MTRFLEIILIFFFIAVSFFLGVKYSRIVKNQLGWVFESNKNHIKLPDLADTENPEIR